MLERLKALSCEAPISVSEYVGECLYNPSLGYYSSRERERVGKGGGDFYTSSSLGGGVFARLLEDSARNLSGGPGGEAGGFEIFELGAEPGRPLFARSSVFGPFDEIRISGNAFVISNELLDARPFDRFVFERGGIFKTFVRFGPDGAPEVSLCAAPESEAEFLRGMFPDAEEPFVLDFSFDALALFERVCSMPWRGALVFSDYFRSCGELLEFPRGTARTYKNHEAGSDIFDSPGERDITYSPPFEPFLNALEAAGFAPAGCLPQSVFFMENARGAIRKIVEESAALSDEKRALGELISPAHLGEVFRVLYAAR